MKKLLITLTAALAFGGGAVAAETTLETSVAPVVTSLQNPAPTEGLYVGNSYSFYNCGVHTYVRGFTREAKQKWKARIITISSGMLSFHDVKSYLSPHDMDPYVKKDTNKMFDVVFLQGMSSEPIDKKRIPTFKKYMKEHIDTIRASGAEPVVVVTWAKQDKPEDTKRLADSIIAEANANNALALPVGLAFAESLKERPDIILHQADKSHPTAAGSYLYGAMVYSLLYKKSPEGFAYPGECEKPLTPEVATHLQKVAWRVMKTFYGW